MPHVYFIIRKKDKILNRTKNPSKQTKNTKIPTTLKYKVSFSGLVLLGGPRLCGKDKYRPR